MPHTKNPKYRTRKIRIFAHVLKLVTDPQLLQQVDVPVGCESFWTQFFKPLKYLGNSLEILSIPPNITPLCYNLLSWASPPLNFVTKWKILYEIFCVKSQQFIYFKRGHLQITLFVSICKGGLQRYKGKSDLSIPTKKL